MAIILRYFAEFGRFHGQFHTSGLLAVDLLFVSDKCHKVFQFVFQFDGVYFQRGEASADFDVNKNIVYVSNADKKPYFVKESVKRESLSSFGNRFHEWDAGTESALLPSIRLALCTTRSDRSVVFCQRIKLDYRGLNNRTKRFKRRVNIDVICVFVVESGVGVLQILNGGQVASCHRRRSSGRRCRLGLVIYRRRSGSSLVGRLQSEDCLRCLHLGVQPLKCVTDTHGQSAGTLFSA